MNNPQIVCSIIIKDDKLLFIKRNKEPGKGLWSLIGGMGALKKQTSADEAIIDEVKYDLGVEFRGKHIFNIEIPELNFQTASVYLGEISGNIKVNTNAVSEYILVNETEIDKLESLAFNNDLVINKYLINKTKYFMKELPESECSPLR